MDIHILFRIQIKALFLNMIETKINFKNWNKQVNLIFKKGYKKVIYLF
jgi:hypothetical protein